MNNLKELKAEMARLKQQEAGHVAHINNDLELLKNELSPFNIFSRASEAIVPEPLRHSRLVNGPINFVARALFDEKKDVTSESSDNGRANQIRNIALSVLETTATYLLTRYIRKKI